MHLTHRKTCRVCGSRSLEKVIDIGSQYLQGSFIMNGEHLPPQRKIETTLVRCDPTQDEWACGLLQTSNSVPPEILYTSYWYRSGTNQTMRDHLRGIVESVLEMNPSESLNVLDIGCNDGTLLSNYPNNFMRYGVDPSNISEQVTGDYKIIRDLFPSKELELCLEGSKLDIITSIAMFYDLEDPVDFAMSIKKLLASNGLWVFEVSYMPLMLKMNSYDTICHEHLEYYSLAVIENILGRAGLQVVNVELNSINGGSIRCYVSHDSNFFYKEKAYEEKIFSIRRKEFDLELDTAKPYKDFQKRIDSHQEDLRSLVEEIRSQGEKIHIYGASTKGNTILQWCGLDYSHIEFAADRNPAKHGAKTLGTNIPIISEEESRKMNPNYYLVLPWHFKEEFLARESSTLQNGTKMIFPLPEIEIVSG